MAQETSNASRGAEAASAALRLWPAALAVLLVGIAYAALPDDLRQGPRWLLLLIGALLILGSTAVHWRGHIRAATWLGRAATALVTAALVASVVLLVLDLHPARLKGGPLLGDAAVLWAINVIVFALWYWEIDNDGPHARHARGYAPVDFAFPQYQMAQPGGPPVRWSPGFIDYLFLAFSTSTAFSPTDTMVLSRRAKILMMTQSVIALVVIVVLAARAINIL